MPEIRDATAADRDGFLALYSQWFAEPQPWAFYANTPKTLAFFGFIFDQYMNRAWDGVALYVPAGAALLWGDSGLNDRVDLCCGRSAQGWGTYVAPHLRGQGLAPRMWNIAKGRLTSMGFDCILGGVSDRNHAPLRGLQQLGVVDLDRQYMIPLR